jgi:galactonate dehydratase
VEALAQVSAASPIPIATGERWSTIYDARKFLSRQALAVAQPDVVNCGGLMQAKKIAALAESEYISIAPHNPNGPVATVASLHLAASIPNFLILETIGSDEDKVLQAEVAHPPLRFEDGCLLLPDGPGLGMELDEEACQRFPYQPFQGWR